MARPKKDPEQSVSEEFVAKINAANDDELNKIIAQLTKEQELNLQAKKDDVDLQRLSEQKKVASQGYVEATKQYKASMKLIMGVLASRGKV